MARPGIMVYFSILEPIMMLSDEDKGRLFVAMLEYGRDGVVPEFDGTLGIAWSFVQPTIDKDGQRYEDMRLQREYALFCKKRKKIWMPKVLFEDWVLMSEEEKRRAIDPVASRIFSGATDNEPLPPDNEAQRADNEPLPPVTQLQLTTNSNQSPLDSHHSPLYSSQSPVVSKQSTSDSTQYPNNNLQPTSDVDDCGGGTDSVVFLSDDQVKDLQSKMGEAAFRHYVDKLAGFIVGNGAKVKNHYETILKWWREDGKPKKQARNRLVSQGATGQLGEAELENIRRLLEEG